MTLDLDQYMERTSADMRFFFVVVSSSLTVGTPRERRYNSAEILFFTINNSVFLQLCVTQSCQKAQTRPVPVLPFYSGRSESHQ